jgi:dTMP kinase
MIKNPLFPGLFFTFEGIDGAGKSTHIQYFSELIRDKYPSKKIILTREPGGTSLGESLREILLHQPMHLETEALLMFAARREHLAQVIEPALMNGDIVISDRFTDASFAYQCGGKGLQIEKLSILEKLVQGRLQNGVSLLLQPNLTFLFDLPSNIAQSRREKVRDPDKFETLDTDFFEKVRQEYLRRASEEPDRFITIDSTNSIEDIKRLLNKVNFEIQK